MLFAPMFGYLGDRWSRKYIMILGLSLWAAATFVGSFMKSFWAFLFFRALVGIGEASYSTIAPAIISDLFTKDTRSKVLALFYFAIPVGTGLGYIIGSEVASNSSDWRWGLRVTPFMGLFALLLIVFFMVDPERGLAEGAHLRPSSPMIDLKALGKNKSFVLSTVGFTCVTFTAGCLMWWGPEFAYLGAKAACGAKAGCQDITQANVSYRFGIVMTMAGLLGVPLGSYLSQIIRHKVPNADPIVCGTTLMLSVPVLFFGFFAARYSLNWCYGLTFLAGLLLNCNWSIVSDITCYIVIPTRRSIANATQILISHALGDAISPYLIGVVADWIRPAISPFNPPSKEHTPEYYDTEFRCLQYALFVCCFFQCAGSYAFMAMSWYVIEDKNKADLIIADNTEDNEPIVVNEEVEGQEDD
jgi:MFS family permease